MPGIEQFLKKLPSEAKSSFAHMKTAQPYVAEVIDSYIEHNPDNLEQSILSNAIQSALAKYSQLAFPSNGPAWRNGKTFSIEAAMIITLFFYSIKTSAQSNTPSFYNDFVPKWMKEKFRAAGVESFIVEMDLEALMEGKVNA